jgi:hypothetical protein
MEVSIPNYTSAHYKTVLWQLHWRWHQTFWPNLILCDNVKKTPLVLLSSPQFGGFCPFLEKEPARGQQTWWWHSRKPILCDNIIVHLLHSCTHLDLDKFCWILYKSRDIVKWSSFGVDRVMEVSIKLYWGTLAECRRQIYWRGEQKI